MAYTTDIAFGYLRNARNSGRLAHAYLVTGAPGSGKAELVRRVVAMVNGGIEAESLDALESEFVRLVRPASKSRRISIDQIRSLEKLFHQRSSSAVTRIGIIEDADRMGEAAENAFLKTLEEPPEGSLLFLLTAYPEQLLETILSRCIFVALRGDGRRPRSEAAQAFRAMLARVGPGADAGTALGMARRFSELLKELKDAGEKQAETAQKAEKERYSKTTDGRWLKGREDHYKAMGASAYLAQRDELIDVLVAWFGDAMRQQCGSGRLDLPEDADHTAALARDLRPAQLSKRFDAVERLRADLSTNVQESLAIEVAFLEAFAGGG